MPDTLTTTSNMACQIFKQLNQTWRARHSNRKLKHGVPDIRTTKNDVSDIQTTKSKMGCQTFIQLNQTWRARYSNKKIKHDVTDIRTIK